MISVKPVTTLRIQRGMQAFEEFGLLFVALTLFYHQNVSSVWRAVVLILAIFGLLRRLFSREPILGRSIWITGILVLCIALYASTQLGAPDFMREYVRDLLLPCLTVPLFASAFASTDKVERLIRLLSWSGLLVVSLNLIQYIQEYLALGHIPEDILLHRRYGDALIVLLPFSLVRGMYFEGLLVKAGWFSLTVIQLVMLVLTGMRGAWMAAALSIVVIAIVAGSKRSIVGLLILAMVAGTAILMAPEQLTLAKVKQGFDTSQRIGGTWGPTLELVRERPFMGHGFGGSIYDRNYNESVAEHPDWPLRTSIGPHSTYLTIAFAGGVAVLALYATLLWGLILTVLLTAQKVVNNGDTKCRRYGLGGLAIGCALFAAYGVHGLFETKPLEAFGVLFGAALGWLSPLQISLKTVRA